MARNAARWGRLRRVLNDEASHGSRNLTAVEGDLPPGDTPRYGAGANIENHPQVTDFVPRRFRVVAAILLAGLAAGAAAEALTYFAAPISEWATVVSSQQIEIQIANRLNAWISATVLLVAAVYARLIHSLRRHRVDDVRGSYRIWRWASFLAIVVSANAVIAGHLVAGDLLGHLCGWTLLENNQGWWLLPSLLCGGFVLARITYDAAECRSALLAFITGIGCLSAGVLALLGWLPVTGDSLSDAIVGMLPLTGYLSLLTGCLLYARYVVLDVQGLIDHGSSPASNSRSYEVVDPHLEESADDGKNEDDDYQWIDGTEPVDDYREGDQRLSKAERKRLRKQKFRNRAA